jgi:hypothetical protein
MTDLEVTCPACGAIVEAPDPDELVARAREHTVDTHHYVIPDHHVLDAAVRAGGPGPAVNCRTTL